MPVPSKITYRVRELVAVTGLSKSTIYRLIADGTLRSFKLNGVRLVLASDLRELLDWAQETSDSDDG